ncbi:helix-turn-helix domain-containing protein [Clostridium chrysemydis]|uniref:helix-turn-helix domain-containing protein n=1 Tax=Clostridium chrysemydis TaxID=2665504 RepID=UPI001884206E|nr:helix-turn-helix transcriptional regulator [Clostridium chrysemydis]
MKEKIAQNLGIAIKEARKKAKLTQQDLSEKTSISRNYISDIECGRYVPSFEKVIELSNFLDLDLNLIKNDGNTI